MLIRYISTYHVPVYVLIVAGLSLLAAPTLADPASDARSTIQAELNKMAEDVKGGDMVAGFECYAPDVKSKGGSIQETRKAMAAGQAVIQHNKETGNLKQTFQYCRWTIQAFSFQGDKSVVTSLCEISQTLTWPGLPARHQALKVLQKAVWKKYGKRWLIAEIVEAHNLK